MKLFRNRTTPTPDAPGERRCRACGNGLADDQLACLECGAVDAAAGGPERRWILPTGGVIGVALFLVTSASFAATTALTTGDPQAIKQKPPAVVAQTPALPPASGDGTAPNSAQQDDGKGPDLGDVPGAAGTGGGGAGNDPAPPADDGAKSGSGSSSDDSGNRGSNSSGGGSGGSGSSGSSGGRGGSSSEPDEPKPVKISEWPDGQEGYTIIVYKFDSKADAKSKAREVAGKGLPAGVIDSDKYASLGPGSWLVYIGEFDSSKQAERAGRKYENAGYPGEVTFVGQTEAPESDPSAEGSGTTTTPQP